MQQARVLVLCESGRSGDAVLDLARELEGTELTIVGVAPQAPSGARCGNTALDYNGAVVDAVKADLDHARERLGPGGELAAYEVLIEGVDLPLERYAGAGGFDLVLLPARRWSLRSHHHPAAARLRGVPDLAVRVVPHRLHEQRRDVDHP